MIKTYFDIRDSSYPFSFVSLTEKPVENGYAITTLKKINSVMPHVDLATQKALIDQANSIQACWMQKKDMGYWLIRDIWNWREEKEIQTTLNQIRSYNCNFFSLPPETVQHIYDFLSHHDTAALSTTHSFFINHAAIQKARRYGFRGWDLNQAKAYLRQFYWEVRELNKQMINLYTQRLMPQEASFVRRIAGLTSQDLVQDIPTVLEHIKKMGGKQLLTLLADQRFYLMGLQNFTHYLAENLSSENIKLTQDEKIAGYHILCTALSNNDEKMAIVLIKMGVLLNDSSSRLENSPLHRASSRGMLRVVDTLIERKANIDCLDPNLRSPLYVALENGRDDVAKRLLLNEASTNILIQPDSPQSAVFKRSPVMVHKLLKHGLPRTKHSASFIKELSVK